MPSTPLTSPSIACGPAKTGPVSRPRAVWMLVSRRKPRFVSKTTWDAMTPEQQTAFQAAATAAIDMSQGKHIDREAVLLKQFADAGLKIYEPDVAAFRKNAQDMYLASDLAKSWEAGIVDKINAL